MINREKIKSVLSVFLELKKQNDSDISDRLESQGLSIFEAERVSAFLPSAFCRIALSHKFDLGFPDTYKVQGVEGEFPYKEEPIYKLAIDIASEIYHNEPELSEVFNSIVTRSAEFNTINKALNEGAEIAGACLSATNYFGYKTLGKKRGLFSKVFS
ncbi:hypothetical protein C1E24_20925 [Pseudoalteromonas phenolica]|uniref:Uncharacterized protein n=1 Tax=Pseudoalteromonas phenolica TaxID=161398 RepID=A0A5R9PY69_9GAMM|nr:hypothetical protein [Pseudoalteromonas phenolica]TLX45067.1 hypothetical protein C1E24_20925 [Pseudoalteromonas phenolica]